MKHGCPVLQHTTLPSTPTWCDTRAHNQPPHTQQPACAQPHLVDLAQHVEQEQVHVIVQRLVVQEQLGQEGQVLAEVLLLLAVHLGAWGARTVQGPCSRPWRGAAQGGWPQEVGQSLLLATQESARGVREQHPAQRGQGAALQARHAAAPHPEASRLAGQPATVRGRGQRPGARAHRPCRSPQTCTRCRCGRSRRPGGGACGPWTGGAASGCGA